MIRKHATFAVLDVMQPGELQWSSRTAARHTGHRHTFDFEPRYGFIYVRSRMISSRCNDNFDEFPAEEIKKAYATFIGKPVFVNHHNEDHRRMRGVIVDAALHEDRNPDGSPDTWVEGLMEVDALKFPKLAEALIKRHIERTSMGVDVEYSVCSKCGNKATTPLEYCRHVPGMKGKRYYSFTASGAKRSELIREKCYGLGFFENSLLVEPPADPTAVTLGDIVMGPGLDHLARFAHRAATAALRRTASQSLTPAVWPAPTETRMPTPTLSKTSGLQLVAGLRCEACGGTNTVAHVATFDHECFDCEAAWNPVTGIFKDAAPRYPDPAQHPWFQENPVSHKNVLQHWHAGTDDEHTQGMNWYHDAHIIAHALGTHWQETHGLVHPGGPAHVGAGIIAVHSPQMGWAGNMHNAARVLHGNKGIGGPGSGMMASGAQKNSDDRILSGERYENVLKGPKVSDFAHLIEHGGDASPDNPHMVVDRHALSVAAGKRMSDADYGSFPTSQRHYYGHVVQQYHKAAAEVSNDLGHPVAAHQVQAATWLTRQRLNQESEKAAKGQDSNVDRLNKGREKARGNAEKGWNDWRGEHLPHVPSAGPGTGYQALKRHAVEKYHITHRPYGPGEGAPFHDLHEMVGEDAYDHPEWYGPQPRPEAARQVRTARGNPEHPVTIYRAQPKTAQSINHGDWVTPSSAYAQEHLAQMGPTAEDHHIVKAAVPAKHLWNDGTDWNEWGYFGEPVQAQKNARLRRRAYGETKAPADVDTLRDEQCPVCGEENAYNGTECKVCGFVAPPKEFQDPDLDMAKRVDLRKDNADLDGADVSDLNDDLNDVDKDGFDDETGEPVGQDGAGGDVQPTLQCDNCGTEFEAGEPMTTDTTDPQAGDAGTGPDAGDVCPACGAGVLAPPVDASPQDDENRSDPEDPEASAQAPEQDEQGIEDEDEPPTKPGEEPGDEDEDPDAKETSHFPFGEEPDDDDEGVEPEGSDEDGDDIPDDDSSDVPGTRKRKGTPARQDVNPFK